MGIAKGVPTMMIVLVKAPRVSQPRESGAQGLVATGRPGSRPQPGRNFTKAYSDWHCLRADAAASLLDACNKRGIVDLRNRIRRHFP